MPSYEVCVRGNGAVAHAAALALARQGLQVALARGASGPAAAVDVRAYAINTASVALLSSLKVWDALPADARTAVYDMHVEGDAAGAALDFSAWSQGAPALAWIADASELDAALRRAADFAPHLSVLDDLPEGVATLQVLAEGRDSAARQRLGVQMPLMAYDQRALATRVVALLPHGGVARQWFRSPDVLALLPLDRPVPERSLGVVWSLPQARAQDLMALPDAAFEQALTDATGGALGALQLAGPRADWPLALAYAEQVCGPGWVLLGDAAHRVHPLAGQGLNLGFADVASLARVISEREPWRALSDPRLLQRYARERFVPTRAMGSLTDGLWQLFSSPQPLVRELRNRGLTLVNHLPPLKRLLAARALQS